MQKRHFLTGGVALAAGVAGAGWAWWRLTPKSVSPTAMDLLWAQVFDDPNGESLPMSQFKGKPLLVNFWATWCPPCVEEMPLLNTFYQAQREQGWTVVGLAIDQPSAVRQFLERMPMAFPIGLAGLAGTELGRELGNERGAMPFTVVINSQGDITHRKLGQVFPDDLAAWARTTT